MLLETSAAPLQDQYTMLTMIINGTHITFFMGMDEIGRYSKEPYTNSECIKPTLNR